MWGLFASALLSIFLEIHAVDNPAIDDNKYLIMLVEKSGNKDFFNEYMSQNVYDKITVIEDIKNFFGGYKEIYDSKYLENVFKQENINDYKQNKLEIENLGRTITFENMHAVLQKMRNKSDTTFIPVLYYIKSNQVNNEIITIPLININSDYTRIFYMPSYMLKQEKYIFITSNDFHLSMINNCFSKQQTDCNALKRLKIYLKNQSNPQLNDRLSCAWCGFFSLVCSIDYSNYLSIDYSVNNIALARKISYLANLTDLYLYHIKIFDFSNNFNGLSNLERLYLENNDVNYLSGITNCTKLKKLFIINNHQIKLPQTLTNLTNLQSLIIENSNLNELPCFINSLTNLVHLSLYDNKISNDLNNLSYLINLSALDLSSNNMPKFPTAIVALTKLIKLDISKNNIGQNDLDSYLPQLTNLKNLSMLIFDYKI